MKTSAHWLSGLLLALMACNTIQAVTNIALSQAPEPSPTTVIQTDTPVQPDPAQVEVVPPATPLPLISAPTPTASPTPNPLPVVRQISSGDCCTGIYWNKDSTEVRFIDQPSPAGPAGVWAVDVTQLGAAPYLVTERLGQYNQDSSLLAYPDRDSGLVIVERLEDGQTWTVDTQGSSVSFTLDNRLIWLADDSEVWWQDRQAELWLAGSDGSNPQRLVTLQRSNLIAWLSDSELLVSRRLPPSQDVMLSKLSIDDGSLNDLVQLPRIRGLLLSPNRGHLVYMTRFEENIPNGLWLLDLAAARPEPEPLPFFGSYRWRDNERLIYIPFDPAATQHLFYEYDLASGQSRPLFPPGAEPNANLIIANNDWQISPDGSRIALVAARGSELDGIWVIELGQE